MSFAVSRLEPERRPGRLFPRPAAGLAPVYALTVFSALLVFLIEFSIPGLSGAMVGAGIGVAVFLLAAYLPGRRWIMLVIAAAAWLVFGLFGLEVLIQGSEFGVQLLVSRFSHAFVGLRVQPPPVDILGERAFWWVLAFAGYLVAGMVSLAMLWFRKFWLVLLCTAPFLAAAFTWDFVPPVVPTVLLLGCWGAALAQGWPKRRGLAANLLPLCALALCLIFVFGVVAGVPEAAYVQSPQVVQARHSLEQMDFGGALKGLFGGSDEIGARNEARVNLARRRNIRSSEGTAFYVRGKTEYGQHLRGFSCGVYNGESWAQLPDEQSWFWSGGHGSSQPLTRPPVASSGGTITLEFRYDDPLAYAHTPYALSGVQPAGADGQSLAFLQDAYLEGGADRYVAEYHAPGSMALALDFLQRQYADLGQYGALGCPIVEVEVLENNMPGAYVDFGEGTTLTSPQDPEDQNVVQGVEITGRILQSDITNAWHILEGYQLLQQPEGTAYSDYVDYIQRAYTQLPAGVAEDMQALAEAAGIAAVLGQSGWIHTAYMVAEYIKQAAVYTTSPTRLPADVDFATWFLTEAKAGYCVHFATAAAVMLRALGVPARYAEGFVVGQAPKTEGWAAIPNKNAHAWVEVWVPGMGWWPVEVTPGGSDAQRVGLGLRDAPRPEGAEDGQSGTQPPDSSASQPDESSASQSQPRPDDSDSSAPSSSDGQGGGAGGQGGAGGAGGSSTPAWVGWLLFSAVALVVGVLAALLVPRWFARRRDRRFRQRDAGHGVLEMYRYLTRLKFFGYAPTPEAEALAGEAAFSTHQLGAAQRRQMLEEVAYARAFLRREAPGWKKALMHLRGL